MDRVLALDGLPAAVRVEALWISCYSSCALGDADAGDRCAADAVRIAQETGDDYLLGTALLAEGGAAFVLNDHDRADESYTKCIELLARSGRHDGRLVLGYAAQAMTAAFAGRPDRARYLALEPISIADACGEQWDRSYAVYALALAEWQTGDHLFAAQHAMESMRAKRQFNDTVGTAMNVELLAWIASSVGDTTQAARLLGTASQMWRQAGGKAMLDSEIWTTTHIACLEHARRQLGEQKFGVAFAEGVKGGHDVDSAVAYVHQMRLSV